MNMNVLFTSVGRRVELVRAFRRAYQQLGIRGKIVGTDIDPLAPAMHELDVPVLVPSTQDPNFIKRIVEVCADEQVQVVFPLIDPDIPRLAAERTLFESTGSKLAVVHPAAAKICADKWLVCDFFEKLGLATPKSWLPGQLDPERVTFPTFLKPRDGSAAMNTFKVCTSEELRFFQRRVPNAIIQEYLEGPEITSDVVCDLAGNVLSIVSRKRIAVRGGEVIPVAVREAADDRALVHDFGVVRLWSGKALDW